MTNWITVHSSAEIRPLEIDATSSEYYVYERRNIHQEQRKFPEQNDTTVTEWVYEERKYTKEEYNNLNGPATQLLMQNLSDMAVELAILKEVIA